mmetsp:Transcript_10370/g.42899  ORF Transcript_10370/g.42899 Transcript_10370/m.42899 type:complete len:250 (+) Transcript_10370:334-1083(+)
MACSGGSSSCASADSPSHLVSTAGARGSFRAACSRASALVARVSSPSVAVGAGSPCVSPSLASVDTGAAGVVARSAGWWKVTASESPLSSRELFAGSTSVALVITPDDVLRCEAADSVSVSSSVDHSSSLLSSSSSVGAFALPFRSSAAIDAARKSCASGSRLFSASRWARMVFCSEPDPEASSSPSSRAPIFSVCSTDGTRRTGVLPAPASARACRPGELTDGMLKRLGTSAEPELDSVRKPRSELKE